jgi:molybdopterin converting factor subunit 1
MNVTVRLFASYAERLGHTELALELPDGSTVRHAIASIAKLPGASGLPPAPLVAVNCVYAKPDLTLNSGDEVALIPPVAGG